MIFINTSWNILDFSVGITWLRGKIKKSSSTQDFSSVYLLSTPLLLGLYLLNPWLDSEFLLYPLLSL